MNQDINIPRIILSRTHTRLHNDIVLPINTSILHRFAKYGHVNQTPILGHYPDLVHYSLLETMDTYASLGSHEHVPWTWFTAKDGNNERGTDGLQTVQSGIYGTMLWDAKSMNFSEKMARMLLFSLRHNLIDPAQYNT